MRGVYLLHFTPRFKHAGHYLGFSENIPDRVYKHEFGQSGVHLIQVAEAAGVQFTLARTWPGESRDFERKLKGRKLQADGTKTQHMGSLVRLCPICKKEKKRGNKKTVNPKLEARAHDTVGSLRGGHCEAGNPENRDGNLQEAKPSPLRFRTEEPSPLQGIRSRSEVREDEPVRDFEEVLRSPGN